MNVSEPANNFRPFQPRRRSMKVAVDGKFITFCYSFIVGFLLLTNGLLSSISAAGILGLGLVGPFAFARQVASNRNVKWVYAFPILSLLSALWSQHSSVTIYYTIQLLLTANVAVVLASFRQQSASLWGFFWVHFLFAAASLIFGQEIPYQAEGYVFVGLSVAKNAYGLMNLFVVVFGMYAAHIGLSRKDRNTVLLGALTIVIGFIGIALSKSSGALVVTILGMAIYLVLSTLSSFSTTNRLIVLLITLAVVILLGLLLSTVWAEINNAVLNYFGKDSDLTGRVGLWLIADQLIERSFWLGLGQYAFWVRGDPLPEMIWAEFNIIGKAGFNFHNTYRELMVHVGVVGLLLTVAVVGFLTLRQVRAAVFAPTRERFIYIVILLTMFWRAPFEVILPFQPVWPPSIFMIAALALRPANDAEIKR